MEVIILETQQKLSTLCKTVCSDYKNFFFKISARQKLIAIKKIYLSNFIYEMQMVHIKFKYSVAAYRKDTLQR